MNRMWSRLLEILDGTPAVYAPAAPMNKRRGQSLVEMALLTPIVFILFAGLVEIGWLANTYLNLLDITRYGARYASTLSDDRSPFFWEDRSSYVPNDNVPSLYEMRYSSPAQEVTENFLRRQQREDWGVAFDSQPLNPPVEAAFSVCGSDNEQFYSDVVCRMILSLPDIRTSQPTRFNPYNGVDDVIVSAFSLELVDVPADPNPGSTEDRWSDPAVRPLSANLPQLMVVGRYPTNANECQANEDGTLNPFVFDLRDPFDVNNNGKVDTRSAPLAATNPSLYNQNNFSELEGFDANTGTVVRISDGGTPTDFTDDTIDSNIEKQVGFQWYGNNVIPDTGCIGSTWTSARIEQLLNLPNYELVATATPGGSVGFPTATPMPDAERRRMLPSQGVVLVEVYWEHQILLPIPVLSPVYEAISRDGTPDLYLWAIFPLPSTDPYIEFG
ncbi:MAG: TadE family protein [bacterium]|nr:TadE family protein [bacterium]